jgi:hypothetical protein
MQHDLTTHTAAVFVCHSNLDLQIACHHLQGQYHLPAFHFDEHSSWEHAHAFGQHIGFNVTRTERLDTIAQWMKGVPENVNYQIMLYLDRTDGAPSDAMKGARVSVKDVYAFLQDMFATNILWVEQHRA